MGLPWLDQPVTLHSSRMSMCKSSLTDKQCAYIHQRWHFWYEADHVYAIPTVLFFIVAIAFTFVGYWSMQLAPASFWKKSWWQRLVGLFRFASYRRYEVKFFRWMTPSVAVLFWLVAGAVFFFAMTLGPKPYYWQFSKYGNSPPIATRAGWMALACLPFLLILATKANMIASLTGVSHERLIVFHNWAGWVMLVLALVHTFPFIIHHIHMSDMMYQWRTNVFYWTGVTALIAQAYLTFMSVPWIRNKFYEFFKAMHFLAALIFVLFLFFHCGGTLTSWDYFIAAGVLYALSFLYSQIRTYFEHGVSLRATLDLVSDQALEVTIPISNTTWQPGQHVFLRFLTLGPHALTAHPFTICSCPSSGKLTVYVRPRGGVSGRLAALAAQRPGASIPVLIDGPYGGVQARPLHAYDRALIVACGAGAGFSLPFVMGALRARRRAPGRRTRIVIATRDARILEWYGAALGVFLEENGLALDGVEVRIHLTSDAATGVETPSRSSVRDDEKSVSVTDKWQPKLPIKVFSGRPDLRAEVRDVTLEEGVSVGIAVCGPSEVLKAVQDEAAEAQLRILSSKAGSKEVYLHSEVFGW